MKMTSKEALESLKFISDKELNIGSQEFWNYRDPLKVLEKLVEKDTPTKIIKGTSSLYINTEVICKVDCYKCPCCEELVLYDRFQNITLHAKNKNCQHCGQRLDWSDDE